MLEIQAVITEVKTMVDEGFRVKIDTQELTPEQAAQLFSLKNKYVKLSLKEDG